MTSPNWNTAVLTTGCIILGAVFGLLLGGWLAPPVSGEPWLKSYQGLSGAVIGVAGAALGLYVATYNVLRTMRMNLMSREEDRIDDALPGMREATSFLVGIVNSASRSKIRLVAHALHHHGFTGAHNIEAAIDKQLPRCDARTASAVSTAIRGIVVAAEELERAFQAFEEARRALGKADGDDDQERRLAEQQGMLEAYDALRQGREQIIRENAAIVRSREDDVQAKIQHARETASEIAARTTRYEELKVHFRREIERHFARPSFQASRPPPPAK